MCVGQMYSDLPDRYWVAIENIKASPKGIHIPYLVWCLSNFFLLNEKPYKLILSNRKKGTP